MNKRGLLILLSILLLAFTLRIYKISANPPGLYWDEVAFGYDAYSILKTARDHHGHYLPFFFESFGDWKLPVFFYTLIPSIALFGLTEFAIRFPIVVFATLTILSFFALVNKLTKNINLALLSAFFLAISPWHIQFSRGGFESIIGLFLVVSGLYLYLLALEKKRLLFFLLSFLLFTLSMYAYHAYRIFTPLLIVAMLVIYSKEVKKNISKLFLAGLLAMIVFIPLAVFTVGPNGRARAMSQSAYSGNDYETKRIAYDQKSKKPFRFLSKYWSKTLYYSYLSTNNYLDHFSPVFLFSKGDQIGRHSQVDMGQIYLYEAVLIGIALFSLKLLNKNTKMVMIVLLLLAPIPAIIVSPTPHAYRTLQMSVPLAFFSGLGAYRILNTKGKKALKVVLVLAVLFSLISYLHLVFVHYPRKFGADWQDGYKDMVQKVLKYQGDYEHIYITNISQVPYIYTLFYTKYDPRRFQLEHGSQRAFYKYTFINPDENIYNLGRVLYAAPSWQKIDGRWLDAVNDYSGKHIYSLWEINEEI